MVWCLVAVGFGALVIARKSTNTGGLCFQNPNGNVEVADQRAPTRERSTSGTGILKGITVARWAV